MQLADGTNSWSGRGKLSEWLQLCTQPQETPLGSNKHRNKCTERDLKKKHVPIKHAVMFPSPLSRWASPCPAELGSSSGDELADRRAKLKTLLGGKRRWLGVSAERSSGLNLYSIPLAAPYQQQQPGSQAAPRRGTLPARRRAVRWHVGHRQHGLGRAHIGLKSH